jgi:YfiR/HmsC-like
MLPLWGTRGRIIRAAAIALFAAAWALVHAAPLTQEYQLKAVFLFNFLQFVDWPATAFSGPHSPLYVCVLGNDPFGHALDDVMADERLDGRPIVIEHQNEAADATHCHLVFIAEDSDVRRRRSLTELGSKPVLTVSDSVDFAERGGIIELDVENNHIKLLVNLQAANDAQLRVSSKLLRKAQIVGPAGT